MSQLLVAQRALTVPGWAKDALWRRAQSIPSLDLRFADSKSLVDATTGSNLVTFTRASSGTFVGSDGLIATASNDVPRFDHNPTTGESLGLLVEEQRTNLLVRSEEFDNASWTKTRSSLIANAIPAPDGSTTADKLVEDTSTNTHFVAQGSSFTSGTSYTLTVYAKAAERTAITLVTGSSATSSGGVRFNLSTGTAAVATGSIAAFSITPLANNWYRCFITQAATSTVSDSWQIRIDNGSSSSYTGDGTSGIYAWGAQLEAGAFPTSYIPTTAATVTRSADVASITGSAFSSWYRQDEGTVFLSGVMAPVITRSPTEFSLNDGTTTNQISGYNFTNLFAATVRKAGEVNTDPGLTVSPVSGANYKKTIAIKLSDYRIAANGVQGASFNPAFVPTVDRMTIGTNPTGGANINSTISRLAFWPQRLANSTLQSITQ